MDNLVYMAAAGAKETMLAQAVNAHNLANVSTVGFKADLVEAETVYLRGEGAETRAYNVLRETGADISQGSLQQTGRELDIAVNGDGWIAVQASQGGEALSRRGDLRVDEFGQLVNGAGEAVLGNDGPIALPPFSSMSIGADGTVSMVPLGEAPNAVAVLDRIKLVNPDAQLLKKNNFGDLTVNGGEPSEADGSVRLVTGTLENSNVNSVGSMVEMIELSRQFEQFMRLVKMADEIDTSSASLMRIQ
ncbi:MAG: flagellar basal-body rod protein FlgF [Halieaceae bacterium]